MTILELLVASAVLTMLVALLLPAVGAARESARRIECVNHLRQIGVALFSYESQHRCLSAGLQWERTRQSAYGWGVPLLPCLEQTPLASQIDRSQQVDSPDNAVARSALVAAFICPSDVGDETFPLFPEDRAAEAAPWETAYAIGETQPLLELPTANYFGVWGVSEPDEAEEYTPALVGEGAFIDSRPIRLAQFERGLSQSLLVGERTMARLPSTWLGVDARGEDAACRLLGNAATAPNCEPCDECEFGSRHPGGANFLWGDGRITLVPSAIDALVYQQSAQRSLR